MDYKQYIQKNKIDLTKKDLIFELSDSVTKARLSVGMSQAELAKKMKTTQPNIARAESGTIELSISFLQKVAKAMGQEFVMPRFEGKKFKGDFGEVRVTTKKRGAIKRRVVV